MLLKLGSLALIAVVSLVRPEFGRSLDRWLLRVSGRLPDPRSPRWYAGLILAAALGLGTTAGMVGIPLPGVHDEFSYLLAADTFASGRLANPPHPLAEHFESFHVLSHPTYASKYPPGQGIFLALGIGLGHPILGVWLSALIATAAVHWALLGWLPARWAALGGALFLVRFVVASYWSHSYWGGHVAALGGALLFGACPRLAASPRAGHAALLGLGLVLLANSRPFEGLIAALLVFGYLLGSGSWRALAPARAATLAAACMLPLSAGGAAMLAYNAAVTGSPLVSPYVLHQRSYHPASLFFFQEPAPLGEYRLAEMEAYHRSELEQQQRLRSFRGFLRGAVEKGNWLRGFYWGVEFTLVLLALPLLLPDARGRWFLSFTSVGVASNLVTLWGLPHYLAPFTPAMLLLLVETMRRLSKFRVGGAATGAAVLRWSLLLCLIAPVPSQLRDYSQPNLAWRRTRADIVARLADAENGSLVVVRYAPNHSFSTEWVYNAADIDASPVVFAHDLGPGANRRLLDYYPDRDAWLLTVGDEVELRPYEDVDASRQARTAEDRGEPRAMPSPPALPGRPARSGRG